MADKSYDAFEACQIILEAYGDADPRDLAPALRTRDGHPEIPAGDGRRVRCPACGWVEAPTADPRYHPEQYVGRAFVDLDLAGFPEFGAW